MNIFLISESGACTHAPSGLFQAEIPFIDCLFCAECGNHRINVLKQSDLTP
jgi:hypothetical protein